MRLRLVLLLALAAIATVVQPMRADAGVVMTSPAGDINNWAHWAKTPYGWDGQWCGRESLTHAPNIYVPCRPAVCRTGKPATDPEWQYVWTQIRDVTFNMRDWKSGTPMFGLTDVPAGSAGSGTPGANEGVIELFDQDLGKLCYSPCRVQLGWGSAYYALHQGERVTSGIAIYSGKVKLNSNPTIPWDADAVPMQLQPDPSRYSLGSAWAHELAHALGLDHPVAGPRSGNLMQCTLNPGETLYPTMDQDTGDTMSWMYAKPFNLYPTPKVVRAC